jgi:hypothetical protein
MSEEKRPEITEQDREDAIENFEYQLTRLAFPFKIVVALDQHKLDYKNSRHLANCRTFIECYCGAGWWFGSHRGDPSAEDEWSMHRAKIIAELLLEEKRRLGH